MPVIHIRLEGLHRFRMSSLVYKSWLGKRFTKGLAAGGAHINKLTLEVVPVDTGRLRNSNFLRVEKAGISPIVAVGYATPYAVYVHEDHQKLHGDFYNAAYAAQIATGQTHSRRPQEKSNFLREPIYNNMMSIGYTIYRAMNHRLTARPAGFGMIGPYVPKVSISK